DRAQPGKRMTFIDPAHALASWFLWIASTFFLFVFALPLLFAPLAWARRVGWRVPEDTHLVTYFGRCVGALATAIVYAALRAAPPPADPAALFPLIVVATAILSLTHLWGAITRTQPWLETAEVGLYAGVAIVAWLVAP